MSSNTIAILGSNGFVGKNIANVVSNELTFELWQSKRQNPNNEKNVVVFDLQDKSTWNNLPKINPDVIIDCIGYGVVKNQSDLKQLYDINYLLKRDLIHFLFDILPNVFWIQIGTAFEYSLEFQNLNEDSQCFPKTNYGISKLLFNNYLKSCIRERFCIFRPFGMFGAFEDESKFFPMLLLAQKNQKIIKLSSGFQKRDYFFVNDLGRFIVHVIKSSKLKNIENQIINIGSGKPQSLRELSDTLKTQIPNFNSNFWSWGAIEQREDESDIFYNASEKAFNLGFELTPLEKGFEETYKYYSENYGRG